jgi:hypothetical protein
MLRNKIQGTMQIFSDLANEAVTHHGLRLDEIVIVCFESDSE